MRTVLGTWLVAAIILGVLGCGVDESTPGSVHFEVDTEWVGDELTVEIDTSLPDGAILHMAVGEDPDEVLDREDGAFLNGDGAVVDGRYAFVFDASAFRTDEAWLAVSFSPWVAEQPDEVRTFFGHGDMLTGDHVEDGPPANPEQRRIAVEGAIRR